MTDPRPVAVVTNLDDPTADLVIAELHDRDVPVVRFDSGDFPATLSCSAFIGGDATQWRGSVRTPTRSLQLSAVRSLYYRRPSGFSFPHLDPQDARFAAAQARYGLGGALVSLPGCLYVNHPHRIGDAEYKPAGLAAAAACGFTVPPTLITNRPDDARTFIKRYGPVIFKPISVPLYLIDGAAQTVPVSTVEADEIDDSVAGTMHLFQAQVDKTADVRVTVIGNRIFAVRIDSGLLDWRTDYSTHTYTPVTPPPDVERALFAYLRHFGLVFGAFDFALAPSGEWTFIECNPSGQWAWMEPPTGLPMTAALADLLERGTHDRRT
ncbi:30S ribosomal protein S6 modification protein RimK [Streptomyces eurocidicus]|uniref:30S ribosomal protein S6 modification protein RimK n=1 Tax=Streptomyces eurocidicus TaxID=66423 RepID=A0A2N8NXT4_STREU|nr:ATP-grasp ribosomal peptide maturase [Streptomyces eurocidicus]MBB5123059.1 ATP-grasp ribosomal peptide maturase [Streptomyces eurocidicus]MBF6053850.1 ATP-grasp ribosomal peptide maturase [Streptomyces eurocidicus]PNE33575.1 30S ribosomal protein S6 modification protein RimK [Streptomyces eurocidicus]